MRIVFSEQFYYPDGWSGAQLPRDLTTHLAGQGAQVEVVCGRDLYGALDSNDQTPDPRSSGVSIRRVPRILGGSIHEAKLIKQLWFYLCALPLLGVRRSPDLFMTQSNPPLLVPMIALVALLHRRPFVIIAQDIYPEVMFAHGMTRPESVVGRLLTRLFAWAYRRAARVVALGPAMAQRLVRKGVRPERIEIISNWATGSESIVRGAGNELLAQWRLAGKFVILYSGNIGIAHDVETPVGALKLLLARSSEVCLVFIGKGSRLAAAERAVSDSGVKHAVQFHPLVSAALLPQSAGLAQVALVTLREGFEGLVVPSKVLGYMARGVPTVYIGPPGDVEQMLLESGGGISLRNGDAAGVARAIQQLIDQPGALETRGAAARSYYQTHLSRTAGLERYAKLIDTVLNREALR